MSKINFNAAAGIYESKALVQKAASEVLLGIAAVQKNEDVLDLACGTGDATRRIGRLTSGVVMGVDISEGMIREAIGSCDTPSNVKYRVKDVEDLDFEGEFDVIYCNLAFQWFRNPHRVLESCLKALKPGGRMAIQAPATSGYCPNFIAALDKIRSSSDIGVIFESFKSPWLFLESAGDYRHLFEGCGFEVTHCEIRGEAADFQADQAYGIFQSGAENGYLNRDNYTPPLTDQYIESFRRLIRESLAEQSESDGAVRLEFFRVYLVACKL